MKYALVVPSNRWSNLRRFIQKWTETGIHWDKIIVVEDGPTKTFELEKLGLHGDEIQHYSWQEIDDELKGDSWIISRHDSAIRSYGFLKAWQQGAEKVFTLDDDCEPIGNGFVVDHAMNLYHTPAWVSSIPGHRTRGLPYRNLGKSSKVALSVGLWTGNSDYDSIQMLSRVRDIEILPETKVMPMGQYFPMCGMNLCFRRDITPLMYFPLMGEGQPYRRFDDIWCGVICKKILDHLGLMVTVGKPYIHHSKASDPFVNLVKEAPGIYANELFWESIDEIPLTARNPAGCMCEIGVALSKGEAAQMWEKDDDYLKKLGRAIVTWANLFPSPENTATSRPGR